MPTEEPNVRFCMRFSKNPRLELRATEFRILRTQNGPVTLKCSEGKAGDGFFEWREGTQALCLCLIRFLSYPRMQLANGVRFVFEGGDNSPAKTLDNVIAKANKANCWQQSVFGCSADGGCRLRKIIKRTNPGRRDKKLNYELEIQHEELSPQGIVVEVDGLAVDSCADLEKLADAIEDQWYELAGETAEWAKVKASRKNKTHDSKTSDPTQPAVPSTSVYEVPTSLNPSTMLRVDAKPLVDLFNTISVNSIITHIVAAMDPNRGTAAVEESLAEILSPGCINVLAERVTNETIDDFCRFFYSTLDDEGRIKKCVAKVIAANPDFRKRLAGNVARSGFRDMTSWFQVFELYCDRAIVIEVEHELIAAETEPGFKEKFSPYAPDGLSSLIDRFSRYGCVSAVRIFEGISKEAAVEQARIDAILNG